MAPNAGIIEPVTKLASTKATMMTAGVRPAAAPSSVSPSRMAAVVTTVR